MAKTKTDPGAIACTVADRPMQLREWGTDRVYPLPPHKSGDWSIGADSICWLQLHDAQRFVSRRHAVLHLEGESWFVSDAGSKNGLWLDGERIASAALMPGAELGIGRFHLIVESPRTVSLRALLGRLIGWRTEQATAIDRGLRSVRAYTAMHAPLWLGGAHDLVSVARRIHREVLGDAPPFVVGDIHASPTAIEKSLRAARGGTICVSTGRSSADRVALRRFSEDREHRCHVIVCAPTGEALGALDLPPLASRGYDLPRVIDEYAADAIATLGARQSSWTSTDRAWLLERKPDDIGEIEMSTMRMVAIREFGGVTHAAPRLGVTHSALSRWLARRVIHNTRRHRREGE